MARCPRNSQSPRFRRSRRTPQYSRADSYARRARTRPHSFQITDPGSFMKTVVTAVIERSDRGILIGQRRKLDSSPLKWEFPGGKMEQGETPEAALARELQEDLRATLTKS